MVLQTKIKGEPYARPARIFVMRMLYLVQSREKMEPVFFKDQKAMFAWFKKNHKKEMEVLVGFYKKGTGKPSVTWPESVDVALCYGWIDGVRKGVDEETYTIRFTPRKAGSIWSAINIAKIQKLTDEGQMRPEGLAAFAKKTEKKSLIYSYEQKGLELTPEYEQQFKANAAAWHGFMEFPPSYRKTAGHWVMSARQEATRQKRLETLMADSAAGQRIKPLSYVKKK